MLPFHDKRTTACWEWLQAPPCPVPPSQEGASHSILQPAKLLRLNLQHRPASQKPPHSIVGSSEHTQSIHSLICLFLLMSSPSIKLIHSGLKQRGTVSHSATASPNLPLQYSASAPPSLQSFAHSFAHFSPQGTQAGSETMAGPAIRPLKTPKTSRKMPLFLCRL